jgi:hypothetical protein
MFSLLANEEQITYSPHIIKYKGQIRENLHKLYSSPNIRRIIKSWMVRLAGHVACMGQTRKEYKILAGNPEGKQL